jgi:hypothetical protein
MIVLLFAKIAFPTEGVNTFALPSLLQSLKPLEQYPWVGAVFYHPSS